MKLFSGDLPLYLAIIGATLSLLTSGHVVLYKRDARAAIGWTGLIWLAPFVGPTLYLILGINRIRRRAAHLRDRPLPEEVVLSKRPPYLPALSRLVDKVVRLPLTPGNRVVPLENGDRAYPEMLAAIREAQSSITLCTYIFDDDLVGKEFAAALKDAKDRGVAVHVLIDAVGARYSFPRPMAFRLRREGVDARHFMPTRMPWKYLYANLRTHRKSLIVDGKLAFTGGLNIRAGHRLADNPKHPVRDLHFRLEGPVVSQLQNIFAEDWHFSKGKKLVGDAYFPELPSVDEVYARAIGDGPDEDFEKLKWTFQGALASAQKRIQIMTPYFLPDQALLTALSVAAMRGVQVDIVLPEKNNLTFVRWASQALYWQVLEHGCRLHLSPGVFDHSKLFVVDEEWVCIGSCNWDPRSLRLNFELNVECYDETLGKDLSGMVDARVQDARQVTQDHLRERPRWKRLRDGAARLWSPYL